MEPLPWVSNPTDLPSQGLTILEIAVNQLWRWGPDWLYADVPWTDHEPTCVLKECAMELKAVALWSLNLVTTDSQGSIGNLLNCEKFSTLSRLLRVTAYAVRAVRGFKNHREEVPTNLTPEELANAEILWMKSTQQQLVSQKDFTAQQKQFNHFADEKGIRLCGRWLSNVDAPFASKYRSTSTTESHPDHACCERSSWTGPPQRSQGNIDWDQKKIMDTKKKELGQVLDSSLYTQQKIWWSPLQVSATPTSTYFQCEWRPSLPVHWCKLHWTTHHSCRPRDRFAEGVDSSIYMLGHTGSTLGHCDKHVYLIILEFFQ